MLGLRKDDNGSLQQFSDSDPGVNQNYVTYVRIDQFHADFFERAARIDFCQAGCTKFEDARGHSRIVAGNAHGMTAPFELAPLHVFPVAWLSRPHPEIRYLT